MKRLIAALLAASLVLTNMTTVYAVEVNDYEVVEEIPTLKYLVVNTPSIHVSESASVLVGLEESNYDSTKLKLEVEDAQGKSILFDVTDVTEDGVLFSKEMKAKGAYTLKALQYEDEEIDLAKIGIQAGFGVDKEVNNNPDAVVEENPNISAEVWTNEGDEIEVQDSLEDALINSAGVQTLDADDKLVIVLDPGHDDTHTGAPGKEEKLNLKIAKYCKEVLDKYPSAKVYMTRKSDACPFPGTTKAVCNENRVLYAKNLGADIYVSFHLNSNVNPSPNGAEVYYPNKNYNPTVSEEGYDLAKEILDNLVELGLANRGTKIQNSANGTLYPDGSLADYYAVIRNSKLNGFPGIIIEHAFLSNAADVTNYLSTEEDLKALGVADANAIIEVYGLKKEDAKLEVKGKLNSKETSYTVEIENIPNEADVKEVKASVWSEKDEKDDLKWYTAKKEADGSWKLKISNKNHSGLGEYNVHIYTYDKSGKKKLLKKLEYTLSKPTASKAKVKSANAQKGKFNVVLSNVSAKPGVSKVDVTVWTKSDKSDKYTYTAEKQANGTYLAKVNISKHKYNYGTFQIQPYVTDGNGNKTKLSKITYKMKRPEAKISAKLNKKETKATLVAKDVPYGSGVSSVQFAVWSDKNDQDDLAWYTAKKQADGSWETSVSVKKHEGTGKHYVNTYVQLKNGKKILIGENTYSITKATANKPKVKSANAQKGKFNVVLSKVSAKSGVSKVEVTVWTQSDKKDKYTYTAELQSDGTYLAKVNISNHKYNYGTFEIHAYVTDKNGNKTKVSNTTYKMKRPAAKVTTKINKKETKATLVAKNVPYGSGASSVKFAVWSKKDGIDDIVWYTATKQSDGSWEASAPTNKHKGYGVYCVNTYVQLKTGSRVLIGENTYSVTKPTASRPKIKSADASDGEFKIYVKNLVSKSGVSKVEVPVWTQEDESDIKKYIATKQADGSYLVKVNVANHKYNYGTFKMKVNVVDGNGNKAKVAEATYTMKMPKTKMKVKLNSNESKATITASDVPYGKSTSVVKIAVWSKNGGKDDLKWYTMKKQSNGSWKATVSTTKHQSLGTFHVQLYVTTKDNTDRLVTKTTYLVQNPEALPNLYQIMGKSSVSVKQMVAYYKKNATYPAAYKDSDAPTIEDFCKIYYEESKAEGIKAEVAFAQAMKETGFLKYGGDVSIEQYNFAGIGATGNGNPGNSFASVREGVRAQVQHLKAYASTEDLKKKCVDPRFKYVKRGVAPYVEWLGIQENPSGAGWATAKDYGNSIKNHYIAKMLIQ